MEDWKNIPKILTLVMEWNELGKKNVKTISEAAELSNIKKNIQK